mgnify:CR=1 FL=1
MAKRLNPVLRFVRAILPVAIGIMTVTIGFETWLVYRVTHPRRTAPEVSPGHYQIMTGGGLSWTEEEWENPDGTKSNGWFLRGVTGSPAIILNHGYGRNRSELLNLGVKLCESGYHVLLPDLRGHGNSPVNYSSLGVYERDDLIAAVNFIKGKKNQAGQNIVDGNRIGVFGMTIGGYAAITAAAEQPTIRLVVADSVYPRPDWMTESVLKEMFNFAPSLISKFADWGLTGYFWGQYDSGSAEQALMRYKGQKLWLITANTITSNENGQAAMELFQQAQLPKEMLRIDRSRSEAQEAYDDRILTIFKTDLPR